VEYDTTPKPARAGNGTGHDEDVLDVVGLDAPGFIVPPAHALEVVTPLEGHEVRAGAQDDGRTLLDATDQISRHALGQPVRSHEHVDRKSTRLNSSHQIISYAVFCLKK